MAVMNIHKMMTAGHILRKIETSGPVDEGRLLRDRGWSADRVSKYAVRLDGTQNSDLATAAYILAVWGAFNKLRSLKGGDPVFDTFYMPTGDYVCANNAGRFCLYIEQTRSVKAISLTDLGGPERQYICRTILTQEAILASLGIGCGGVAFDSKTGECVCTGLYLTGGPWSNGEWARERARFFDGYDPNPDRPDTDLATLTSIRVRMGGLAYSQTLAEAAGFPGRHVYHNEGFIDIDGRLRTSAEGSGLVFIKPVTVEAVREALDISNDWVLAGTDDINRHGYLVFSHGDGRRRVIVSALSQPSGRPKRVVDVERARVLYELPLARTMYFDKCATLAAYVPQPAKGPGGDRSRDSDRDVAPTPGASQKRK